MSRGNDRGGFARGVILVMAAQSYFLLHAEFGLVDLLRRAGAEDRLRVVMGLLAAGGLLGCLWAARGRVGGAAFRLRAACVLAGAGSLLAWSFPTVAGLAAAATVSGLGLGLWTAALAGSLTNYFGDARSGLGAGLGVGLAYAFCNIGPVFHLSGSGQALLGVLLAGLGLAAVRAGPCETVPVSPAAGRSLLPWLALFLGLIWFDSAVFYLFNHLPAPAEFPDLAPRSNPWGADGSLPVTATAHLFAAMLAGWLWDRGAGRSLLAGAFFALCLASLSRSTGHAAGSLTPYADAALYAGAVSVYSTLLVAFPSSGRVGSARPAVVAAVLYAVAGWIGSALGIGLAQEWGRVPGLFVLILGLAVVWAAWGRRRVAAVALVSGTSLAASLPASRSLAGLAAEEEGREVYRNEGCHHCHSQYVRPVVADLERWGSPPPLETWLAQTPPLPGNRRQGPDLSLVGLRRGPQWIRLHLTGRLPSGSRMPPYGALGVGKVNSLVSYLSSLGREQAAERAAYVSAWTPHGEPGAPADADRLFSENCALCHGPAGRGDGPWAHELPRPPRDLLAEPWLFIREPAGSPAETAALARIAKFGIVGTEMPGHEWLTDSDSLALAGWISSRHHPLSPQTHTHTTP